jgi:CubicO group peptidase (beta-lactamase class C family)
MLSDIELKPVADGVTLDGRDFPISGEVSSGWEGVVDAFRQNFLSGEEVGASACVWLAGRKMVDLWGGYRDEACSRLWSRDTLVNGMSSTKPVAAVCFHMLVDRGQVSYDDPIDRYWPEFAQNGKAGYPIRYILDHRIGLPLIPQSMWPNKLFDWDAMVAALAAEPPLWEPGTNAGYHVRTYGFLLGEVFRRIEGRTLGKFLHEEIAEPFGVDYWIGLPSSEHGRVAEFISETKGTIYDATLDQQSLLARASPAVPREIFNSSEWMSAELPASNGHGNARSLSQFYAILANGGSMDGKVLLSPETLRIATTVQHEIHEIVMDRTYRQALGFLKSSPPIVVMGPEREAFGHQGAGGALGFGDPVNKVGFAYLQNKMHARRENGPRAKRLIDAAYAAL